MTDKGLRRVIIVGAGIVGIATALWLQHDGWTVTLVDRSPPAEGGASAGNAGLIATHISRPIGMPGIWKKVPAMMLSSRGPLSIRWAYGPRIAPWLARLLASSRPHKVERIAVALQSLLSRSWNAYQPLIEMAGAEFLIRREGVYAAYRSEADIASNQIEIDLLERVGVRLHKITGAQLKERVGQISPNYQAGIYYPDSGQTIEPLELARALFQAFVTSGGTFHQGEAESFLVEGASVTGVTIAGIFHGADHFVCAAGAWSKQILEGLNIDIPLDTERGYNVTLKEPGVEIKAPVILTDIKAAVTPLRGGLRVAGSIEFGGTKAPATPARYEALLRGAGQALPGIDVSRVSRWMGFRPSLPDSLPVIGRSPKQANLYLAFGHGHLGLTTAAITGKLLADLLADRPTALDLTPFSAERFGWL